MSGAHDVARDAAKRLLQDVRRAREENQVMILGVACIEDIETIAEYLGAKEDE